MLAGRPQDGPLALGIALDLTSPDGRTWLASLALLLDELRRTDGFVARSAAYRETFERMLIGGLVLAAPGGLDGVAADAARLRPRTVTRVLELIDADPGSPLVLADLAAHAGVSARRLQQSFQEHMGCTPTEHLRAVRLDRARHDVLHTDLPISAIAARWGFGNLGRFAAAYRRAYGSSPREARRAR
jgi:AraC-like DNA-binding protein